MENRPRIDFDVVHTAEVVLVRIYFRNRLGALEAHAEVTLSPGADFLSLYDSFRREYKWPTSEHIEQELLPRYKGEKADRAGLPQNERTELASRDLAEFFKTWLLLRGRGSVIAATADPS